MGSCFACIIIGYVLGMFSFTRDKFLMLPRNLQDLDKLIFIYSKKMYSQTIISFTLVGIMVAIAITSNSYLMNFYGQKIGWSWFYSCIITMFVDFIMWDWFCTVMTKCCNCGCCQLLYRMFCYLKISKMMSYDGWLVTKQEPGKTYLERIREVTVNEMLGLEENKIERDSMGNLVIKNPIEERRRHEAEKIAFDVEMKAKEEHEEMLKMNIEEIEEMNKNKAEESKSGVQA
jgi:hypothetical protein